MTKKIAKCIGAAMLFAAMSPSAFAQCGGTMLATPTPNTQYVVGQSLVIDVQFGPLGQAATINAVVVNLECQNAGGCGSPCTDDGLVLRYDGDDTIAGNTCGQTLSTPFGNAGTTNNSITFTFANPINLAAGATCSFEFGVTILDFSNDATPKQITGTAQTEGLCTNGLPLSACGSYLITLVDPQINIVKTANPTEICEGESVTYTYVVTNPGDVPLSNVIVVDDNGTPGNLLDDFNPTFVGGDVANIGFLDPGEVWTYTHVTTSLPVGTTTNTAEVSGDFVNAVATTTVMDDDDAVVVVNPLPSCSITPTPGICETTYTASSDGCDATFQWTGPGSFSQSGPSITLGAGSAAGEYCVVVTDCNGCQNEDPCCIDFDPPVGPSCTITAPTSTPDCGSTGNMLSAVVVCPVPPCTLVWSLSAQSMADGWAITAGQGTDTITYTAGNTGTTGEFNLEVTGDNGCVSDCQFSTGCGGGGEGCTPGYWKQPHHFSDWGCGLTPQTKFDEVCAMCNGMNRCFEDAFGEKTLLTILSQPASASPGPNALNSLGRHTVAALLNSCALGKGSFGLSTCQVINMFNAVYPGTDQQYNQLKNTFAALNEQGCPLNGQADMTDDGLVNQSDLNFLMSKMGTTNKTADINNDRIVNAYDLAILMSWWNQ